MITRKQAIELSIVKWKAIVNNDGNMLSPSQLERLGLNKLKCSCGLCELYLNEDCVNCPLNKVDCIDIDNRCWQDDALFGKWYDAQDCGEMDKSIEYAKLLVDELNSIYKKEQ